MIPLSQQLEYFKEYKERLKEAKGEAAAEEIVAGALYLFSIGTNDFLVNYFVLPLRRAHYTPSEYVAFLAGLAGAAVRETYGLGARNIVFSGLAPFGCMPAARTMNRVNPGECNEEYNRAALEFNAAVRDAVVGAELPGARVVYSELYGVVSDMVGSPEEHGFENAAEGCCGTGYIETSVLCGMDQAFTCRDADKYVFFDSVHPSERAYEIVADHVLSTALHVFL